MPFQLPNATLTKSSAEGKGRRLYVLL